MSKQLLRPTFRISDLVEYFDYDQTDWESNFPGEFDINEFLEESQAQEQELLEQELERINEQLEERQSIHLETVDELESKLDWYIERLKLIYQRRESKGKEDLKQRIEEFYRELREQERKHWHDRQDLETERRKILREIDETALDELLDLL